MAKLTQTQKEQATLSAEYLADMQMRVFFSREARIMVGIMPHNAEMPNPNTFRVYVTQCHTNDEFKKKLGLIELGNKFDDNNFVLYRNARHPDSLALELMEFFCYSGIVNDMKELDLETI